MSRNFVGRPMKILIVEDDSCRCPNRFAGPQNDPSSGEPSSRWVRDKAGGLRTVYRGGQIPSPLLADRASHVPVDLSKGRHAPAGDTPATLVGIHLP